MVPCEPALLVIKVDTQFAGEENGHQY